MKKPLLLLVVSCLVIISSPLLLAQSNSVVQGATKDKPFVNSLGMKFVPVPGTKVLFSIWDTRVQDYRVYAEANAGVDGAWKSPWGWMGKDKPHVAFTQGDEEPVVEVSWDDAKAFCVWLTKKERSEGKIGPNDEYRLPTDKEWTTAAGTTKYPWGDQWPPPKGVANYWACQWDDYVYTSPVGSFPANPFGLYDMGGNVWQFCEDWYRGDLNDPAMLLRRPGLAQDGGGMKFHVTRGSSWHLGDADDTQSGYHINWSGKRGSDVGFRCVLASGPLSP